MKPFVPLLLFVSMPMGVNHQQHKNNQPSEQQHLLQPRHARPQGERREPGDERRVTEVNAIDDLAWVDQRDDMTAWAKAGQKGLPDGMDVDQAGNLFATGPGGLQYPSVDERLRGRAIASVRGDHRQGLDPGKCFGCPGDL